MSTGFVHLRLHSEYSVVDGIVRIDDAVEPRRRTACRRWRSPTSPTCSALVKFYPAARSAGVKPIVGCDVWLTNEADRDKPVPAAAALPIAPATCKLCELLTRAYSSNQHRGRAEMRHRMVRRIGIGGADRAVGRARRRRRPGAAAGQRRAARGRCRDAAGQRCFPDASTSSCSAPGRPDDDAAACNARVGVRGASLRLPVGRDAPGAVPASATTSARTKRGCASPKATSLADQRRPRAFTPEQYFKTQAEMAELFRRPAGGARQQRRDRAALQPDARRSARASCRRFPTPDGVTLDEHLRRRGARRASSARLASAVSRRGRARRTSGPRIARGSTSSSRRSCRWASPATS